MRCIILESLHSQWRERQKYFLKTTNLWTYLIEAPKYYTLVSMPSTALDTLFIVGHNDEVYDYMKKNIMDIKEKTIVIISCNKNYSYGALVNKNSNLYICNQKHGTALLYDKDLYNFPFDVTESELMFYNSKEPSIYKKIDICFTKLI